VGKDLTRKFEQEEKNKGWLSLEKKEEGSRKSFTG
jgi:hypothetical protein